MEKVKQLFELATIFFKTLVKLFNAMGVAGAEGADDNQDYYEYLNIVHDGAETVLDSGILEDLAK